MSACTHTHTQTPWGGVMRHLHVGDGLQFLLPFGTFLLEILHQVLDVGADLTKVQVQVLTHKDTDSLVCTGTTLPHAPSENSHGFLKVALRDGKEHQSGREHRAPSYCPRGPPRPPLGSVPDEAAGTCRVQPGTDHVRMHRGQDTVGIQG